ncbi:MAG TPA: hypothetical protein VGH23_18995 [Rhizomicrobium sp.]
MTASFKAGMKAGMSELRKITVQVPQTLLEKAQAYTGEGVTQTVTAALKRLASVQAQQEALKLRGKVKFSVSYDEIKRERE